MSAPRPAHTTACIAHTPAPLRRRVAVLLRESALAADKSSDISSDINHSTTALAKAAASARH